MVFTANKEQIESYTFKDMLLQPNKSYFLLAMIKYIEAQKSRSFWTLMKNSEVNNKHKTKMGNSKIFYPFGLSSARDSHIKY